MMTQIYKSQSNSSLIQASNSEIELTPKNFAPKKHNPKIYQKILKKAQDIEDQKSEAFAHGQ